MKLLIEPADNQHPLSKSDMEELLREVRSEELPPEVQISLREREPGVGELASFAHLWQFVLEWGGTGAGVAAISHMLNRALPQVLKYLAVREQAKVKVKVGAVTLEAPAHMSHEDVATLVDRVVAASGKTAPAKSPANRSTASAKKKATKKSAAKHAARKRTRS